MLNPDHHQRDATRREARLVDLVIDAMGLEKNRSDIYSASESETGYRGCLTFSAFRSVFQDFPCFLTYENLYKLTKHSTVRPRDIVLHPGKSIIADKYNCVLIENEYEAADRPVAMLFPYGRIRGGMVLHNGSMEGIQLHRSARVLWTESGNPRCIQTLHSFLLHLRHSNWEQVADSAIAKIKSNFALELMPKLQDNAGYRILTLLWHLERDHSSSQSGRRSIAVSVERYAGRRWLKLTRNQISIGTGLSDEQVKNGLKRLRQQGLINVSKSGRINLYRIADQLSALVDH